MIDAIVKVMVEVLCILAIASAEALKGIHVLQDRMRGVEGMLECVRDMLQGFDEE